MEFMLSLMPVFKAKGFTLIELLIVISIIGILASITLASYSGAQAKARDGIRKSDFAQLKRALELAKSDCTGSAWYPYEGGSGTAAYALLKTFLGSPQNYMNPVPNDPTNSGTNVYGYTTSASNGDSTTCAASTFGAANYSLSTQLERTTDADGSKSRTTCDGKPGVPASGSYVAGYYYVCNN